MMRRARVKGEPGVLRHELRVATVLDHAVDVLRNPAVALGDDHIGVAGGPGQIQHPHHGFRRSEPAVGAEGVGRGGHGAAQRGELGRREAHHGAAVGVEAERAHHRKTGDVRPGERGFDVLVRRQGLDPEQVRAAFRERAGLGGKCRAAFVYRQFAERREELAGRAHGTRDDDGAIALVRYPPRDAGGVNVELGHPVLASMQRQPVPVPPEAVGEDDVRAGRDEVPVQALDPIRVLDVPRLRGVARAQAHVDEVGARRTVGEQPGSGGEQAFEDVRQRCDRASWERKTS